MPKASTKSSLGGVLVKQTSRLAWLVRSRQDGNYSDFNLSNREGFSTLTVNFHWRNSKKGFDALCQQISDGMFNSSVQK